MTRADIVGSTTAGGYLTYAENIPCADALRPLMVVGGLGCTYIDASRGNINLPKQTGAATASWLPAETTQISESDQTLGQQAYSPHTVGGYTEMSRLLMLQAAPSSAEFVVRRDLIAIIARALDLAALQGPGSGGAPQGLTGMGGVGSFSGTAASLASIVAATVSLSNALNESTGVAASLSAASVLKQRSETAVSTRLLWEGSLINGTCTGLPARSTTALSGAAMYIGSWNYLNIVTWGEGIEVLVNPYATGNFQAGIVGMRAMLTADVSPTWPGAFTTATTVT
jgi:HK97 family phage major capsid protein